MTRFKSNLPHVRRAFKAAAKRGLEDAGMVWHGDAIRLTPVDTGLLRASLAWVASGTKYHQAEATGADGKVSRSAYRVEAPDMTLRLGTNVHYAPIVHEDLNAQHDGSQTAKFVESPLRQRGEVYVRVVRDALREGMK